MARKHLDRRLSLLRQADGLRTPPRGWIRAIRESVGMSATQLARRMRVSQPRIAALEQGEVEGVVSLNTLCRAAAAMDCTLVYALVPNKPLETMIQERARKLASEQLGRADHTMRLEDQAVEQEDLDAELERMVAQLVDHPRPLWDKP